MRHPILIFSTRKWNPISFIIRILTRSKYSHVEVIMPSHANTDFVVAGASWRGVKYRYLTLIQKNKWVQLAAYKITSPSQEHTDKFYNFIRRQHGKKFDYLGLFGWLFKRDWCKDDKWSCSEIHAAAARYAQFAIIDEGIQWVTIQDLINSAKTVRAYNYEDLTHG